MQAHTSDHKVLNQNEIVQDGKESNNTHQVLKQGREGMKKDGQENGQNQGLQSIKESNSISQNNRLISPGSQHPTLSQQLLFHLIFTHHTVTFSLKQQTLTISAQQQLNRTYFTQTFTHDKFTSPMKALFESVNDLWSILQSSKENILFDDEKKLWFKIKLSNKKDKSINIPLAEKQYTDPEYIVKLQQLAKKYMQLTKSYQQQQQKNNDNKTKIMRNMDKLDIKGIQKKGKHFTMPTDFNLDSQRSKMSQNNNNWPQFSSQEDQADDPLMKFDKLLQRLSYMRDNFTLLAEQVQSRIRSKSDPKLIKVKLLYLQQRKKSFQQQLQSQKMNFVSFECKDDIYHEIDELVRFLKQKYSMLQGIVVGNAAGK